MFNWQWLIMIGFCMNVVCNDQFLQIPSITSCERNIIDEKIEFICQKGSQIENINIEGIDKSILNRITKFEVTGMNTRGPLTKIPADICRLKELKYLNLSYNQIHHVMFNFTSLCLSQLEILDLSNNFLSEIPHQWISQLTALKSINLSNNNLTSIPYSMFYNISNIENFNVSSNNLTTFELWLIQIKTSIDYSNNRVTHFTNHDKVDLSNDQFNITEEILLTNNEGVITEFYDNIFEMYNRCTEILHSNSNNILMKAIKNIHDNNHGLLSWGCSCERYYLQRYILSVSQGINFYTWRCTSEPSIIYSEKCMNQSSFNFENSTPRLCSIKNSFDLANITDLEILSNNIYEKLITLNTSDSTTIHDFARLIDYFNTYMNITTTTTTYQTVTENIQKKFQNIIQLIEYYLESIDSLQNISSNSVGILSLLKTRSIYSYSQIKPTNSSSLIYSIETTDSNSIASINIDKKSIEQLSDKDIYTFYYLPSSLFYYAQNDPNIIIISPIVGIHFLNNHFPRLVNMSFLDELSTYNKQAGYYLCVFWQYNQWNDTGCIHSLDYTNNRHFCLCNHTTSFSLIFIPHKTQSYDTIPTIVIAILSILCFSISIILSIHRQAKSFRHLSIANIFALMNSIILFILLTVIIIRDYHSSSKCSIGAENLAIAIYFFLLLTFASKTLLGINYCLTIVFQFTFIEFTTTSNGWFYGSFFLAIFFALIPTIIINIIKHQWTNLFIQYENLCWFNTSYIFRLISIPILISIGLNLLIILGITIQLIQFFIGRRTLKKIQKRMSISIIIWIALCILLGIAWIFGPFLDFMIPEKTQSSSSSNVLQMIFGLFNGLEGVWVLMVNIFFYFNQKLNVKTRSAFFNKRKF